MVIYDGSADIQFEYRETLQCKETLKVFGSNEQCLRRACSKVLTEEYYDAQE